MAAPAMTHDAPWSRAKVGMASLILAEIAFFAVFVVAYLFYIGKSASGPQPAEVLEFPWLATVALLSSSATVAVATNGLAAGHRGRFLGGMAGTLLLGGTFLVFTAIEWRELIWQDGLTIQTNLFGTTFYSLVGFHAAHVTVGLFLLGLVTLLGVLGKVRVSHAEKVEMLAWYWHFVDAVWIVVLTTVYVVGV